MSVDGTDVVYKDIIEPLESASVTISKTDKSSVTEFGNPLEVTAQFFVCLCACNIPNRETISENYIKW